MGMAISSWNATLVISICVTVAGYNFFGDRLFVCAHESTPASALLIADPKIGERIGIQGRTGKETLLLVLGDCMSCQLKALDTRKLRVDPKFEVIVIHRPGQDIPDSLRRFASREIADEGGLLEKKLNAAWFPRLYVLDAKGKMAWLQPAPLVWPEGVTFVD